MSAVTLCFHAVGLVIWPVKIVPEMTYNVLSGMLSLYTTTTNDNNDDDDYCCENYDDAGASYAS